MSLIYRGLNIFHNTSHLLHSKLKPSHTLMSYQRSYFLFQWDYNRPEFHLKASLQYTPIADQVTQFGHSERMHDIIRLHRKFGYICTMYIIHPSVCNARKCYSTDLCSIVYLSVYCTNQIWNIHLQLQRNKCRKLNNLTDGDRRTEYKLKFPFDFDKLGK